MLLTLALTLVLPGLPAVADPEGGEADHEPYHGAEPAMDSSANMELLDHVPRPGPFTVSDLAFQGNQVFMGNYGGFQIIDVSSPSQARVLADVDCPAAQNDISVHRDILILSVDRPQTGPNCGAEDTSAVVPPPADGSPRPVGSLVGWEGIRIFDISDRRNPVQVGAVATDCGSHTHTLVPDQGNGRVLVYVSSYSLVPTTFGPTPYGTDCGTLEPGGEVEMDQISVVEVPLDNPGAASLISEPVVDLGPIDAFDPDPATDPYVDFRGGNGCHDIGVFLEIDRAAGACGSHGVIFDITDRENPVVIDMQDDPNVAFYHSGAFSWDGEIAIFGDEEGGGGEAQCQPGDFERGQFSFNDAQDLSTIYGYYRIPRDQAPWEVCVAHNYNPIPVQGRNVLASAWYLGGTSMVDFNDPANPFELGYFDYETVPIDPDHHAPDARPTFGGSWSSYWHNGLVFSSTQRGLDIYAFTDDAAAGARTFRRLNPQTQVELNPAECTITGTEGDDVLRGTDGMDVICGLGGDDVIYGGGNDDLLIGGDGDDTIYGGDGNDSIAGGAGDDTLFGGRGRDVLYGEDGDDKVRGGRYHDILVGGAGNDDLRGGQGHDSLLGGEGDDTIFGDTGRDSLFGDAGDDYLHGSQGDDRHDGGPGTDKCNGAAGNDVGKNCERYLNMEQVITEGRFQVFGANTDLFITGGAELVRMRNSTTVRASFRGLEPGVTYGSHVHNQPCDVAMGGAHYQHDPSGPPVPPNELWPSDDPANPEAGVTADSSGGVTGEGVAPWRARPEAQSVVLHAPDGTRIACADLT